MSQPALVDRPEQQYVALRASLPMERFATDLPPLVPQVVGWALQQGLTLTGPPFFKYDLVNMSALMELEVGVTVSAASAGDDQVVVGVLPAGRYASVVHVGHPAGLMEATGDLLTWAKGQGLAFDVEPSPQGDRWAARLELYRTDPRQEPNMDKWETELAFKLAD
jgi:effector-binding domain-containing protein